MRAVVLALVVLNACRDEAAGELQAVHAGSLAEGAVRAAESLVKNACKGMPLCSYDGQCSLVKGQCRAGSDADCNASLACVDWGTCSAKEGRCIASEDAQCKKSWICRNKGRCSAKNGKCVVDDDADCGRSELCKHERKCRARHGRCVKKS